MQALIHRRLPCSLATRSSLSLHWYRVSRLMRLAFVLVTVALSSALPVQSQERSAARTVQQVLVQRGYAIGAVDGLWGPRSLAALKDLQTQLGIEPTGQPDATTLEALTRASPGSDRAC